MHLLLSRLRRTRWVYKVQSNLEEAKWQDSL